MNTKSMSFNLLGPQGSGKGTQAKALLNHFDLFHFDAGEELRNIRSTGSELGREIASYIDGGNRVPPQLIADLTYEELSRRPAEKDILFDGLLRSLDELAVQRQTFDRLQLDLPVIIFLDVDESTALERIAKRRICVGCGERKVVAGEAEAASCLRCGGHLEARHDDTPDATRQRLAWYYRDTLPVVKYFQDHGTVISVDARPPIADVTADLITKVTAFYQQIGRPVPLKDRQ